MAQRVTGFILVELEFLHKLALLHKWSLKNPQWIWSPQCSFSFLPQRSLSQVCQRTKRQVWWASVSWKVGQADVENKVNLLTFPGAYVVSCDCCTPRQEEWSLPLQEAASTRLKNVRQASSRARAPSSGTACSSHLPVGFIIKAVVISSIAPDWELQDETFLQT